MFRERCEVLENKKIAPGHYVLKLASARISKNAKPGQFVQILCTDSYDPLLPRPFSFLTASKKDFSILYQVVGNGTKILSQAVKDDLLWILGPLGNGFTTTGIQRTAIRRQTSENKKTLSSAILVGGGVGIPPLYHLAQVLINRTWSEKPKDIHVFLGARHKSLLLCEKDFKKLGVDLKVATDDGSKGNKGFVTEILEEFLGRNVGAGLKPAPTETTQIYTCGPTPMLKAVSLVSEKYEVPCEVSVEVPMACGFGACLGCAIRIRSQNKNEDLSSEYRFAIACCEGPVFQSRDILWE